MYGNILQTMSGIEIISIIPMFLFIICFIGLIVYVKGLDKNTIDKYKSLPFEDENILSINKGIKSDG